MKRLTINGQVVDISDVPSAITYKYLDITGNLSERSKVYSSGITLPYTARNKSIFGYSDVVGGSKKVNPNLILNGYRMYSSSENVGGVTQTTTMQLTAGKTYTFSVKGSKASAEAISLIYIDRIISGVRWAKDLELPVSGIQYINSTTFVCPETGEYTIGYWFQSGSLCVVDWLMLQEGDVYVDQNTTFKQTAEEAVANLENLLEDSVERSITSGDDGRNPSYTDLRLASVFYNSSYPQFQVVLLNNFLYTFTINNSELSSGDIFSVILYNVTDDNILGSPLVDNAVPVGVNYKVTFRVPNDSKNWALLVYAGVRGYTDGKTITVHNLMLQYGPFSTKWYKYGITPTVIPISAERGTSNVDLFIGDIKAINKGRIRLNNMDANGYNCSINGNDAIIEAMSAILVDEVCDNFDGELVDLDFATAAGILAAGINGVLLARDLMSDIKSADWIMYNNSGSQTKRQHWVWMSLAKIMAQMETDFGITFKIVEGGAIISLTASDLYSDYLTKMYIPAYPFILRHQTVSPFGWALQKNVSTSSFSAPMEFGDEVITRDKLRIYGDKSAWDMVKHISQLFCMAIDTDSGKMEVTLAPLNEISNFNPIDLSGRLTEKPVKTPYVEGYSAKNYIKYTASDNAPADYNQVTLTSPIQDGKESDLFSFDLIAPGVYYNSILDDDVFMMNLVSNDMLLKNPLILYQNGDTESTNLIWRASLSTDYTATVNLEKLRMLDTSPFYASLQAWLTKGEMYDCKMALNLYDYSKLKPWKPVRVRELGGDFYLCNINNWNPDKEAKVRIVRAAAKPAALLPNIAWADPSAIDYLTALDTTQLNATADYGGSPVPGTFTYSPAAGTVLNAGTHILTVTFTPTDLEAYQQVIDTASIEVNKIDSHITWNNPAAIYYGVFLSYTQLNATADVPGTFVYDPPLLTYLNAGSHTLSVTFTPFDTTNYNGDTASVTLVVNKTTPIITWANPAAITYGAELGGSQLNAIATTPYGGATVPGTFVYNPAAGAVLNAGTQSLGVTFTPTNTSNYNGNTKSVSLVVNKATPNITWNPTLNRILDGEQWQSGHLNATGSVAGVMTYNYAIGGALLAVGDTLDIAEGVETIYIYATLTPTDSANYDTRTTPSPGKVFNTVAPYLSFDGTINQLNGLVEYFTPGTYDDDIVLHASINFQITVQSGTGFVFKIYDTQISFPYNGSGTTSIVVTGIFSQVDKSQVLLITPEAGSGLNPITLTCHYYKESPE